jgi:integrase
MACRIFLRPIKAKQVGEVSKGRKPLVLTHLILFNIIGISMNKIMNTRITIAGYLDGVKYARSPKTYATYRQAMKLFVAIVGEYAPLTSETYADFLQGLKELSPSTQATYKTALLGLYTYYAENGGEVNILALKAAAKRYVKKKGQRLPQFDREAIEQTIIYAQNLRGDLMSLRDRAFILTLADTGLRVSEACGLRRGDIDWNEKRAFVIGKGDKQGVVRFSNRALDAIRDYLSARAKLDGATGRPLTALPLFVRHDKKSGKRVLKVASNGIWYAIKARIKEAGLSPDTVRVHDFRHYFVTMVYLGTGDLKAAQELARHSDSKTTSLYAHLGGKIDEIYDDVFNGAAK